MLQKAMSEKIRYTCNILCWIVAISGLCLNIYFILPQIIYEAHPDIMRAHKLKPGMSRTEVNMILRAPDRMYDAKTAPEYYYIEGYTFTPRKINNLVYIYIDKDMIAYVYFDEYNNVEYVHIGGS